MNEPRYSLCPLRRRLLLILKSRAHKAARISNWRLAIVLMLSRRLLKMAKRNWAPRIDVWHSVDTLRVSRSSCSASRQLKHMMMSFDLASPGLHGSVVTSRPNGNVAIPRLGIVDNGESANSRESERAGNYGNSCLETSSSAAAMVFQGAFQRDCGHSWRTTLTLDVLPRRRPWT